MRLKEWLARIDKGFFVALAISLLAIWPFLSIASLPEGTDAELHIFRLHELSLLVRGGELYGRWAPNFYHGYGYPIFNYYAPLTYYLGLFVELMPRLDAVDGVKAVFVLGMLLGAIGMYGFVRDNWGRRAGYVATAVFLYAPYIQYIDPHARGVLPESFSFGVFPMALWSLDKVRRSGGRWAWLTAVFFTSAVILSHNLMGLLFFGILFAWALWQVVSGKVANWQSGKATLQLRNFATLQLFAALLLGLGLAAFFWLPVFLERDAVNLNTLLGAGDNYDFRTHFLSWPELLTVSKWLDWGATQPDFVFNLGVPQWVLGGLGLVMLLLRRVKQATHLTFFALATAVLLFLMFPASMFVWEATPILPFFQFPWRLLGATAVMLAILAGAAVSEQGSRGTEGPGGKQVTLASLLRFVPALFVFLPIIFALPLLQPAPWPDFGPVFTGRLSEIEHKGRWLGTTSTADYVPATVESVPGRNGRVVTPLYEDKPADRVNWVAVPEGTAVTTEVITPLFTHYMVDAPKKFRLRLFLFDFPGWQVRIDGEPVETELGRPEGFIVVPVPAGKHLVEVEFISTPARTWAWFISGVSLFLTLLIAWQYRPSRITHRVSHFTLHDRLILIVVLGITAVTLLILQPIGWLHYDSSDFVAEAAETAVSVNFGDQIALIGYDISAEQASPGEAVDVTVYWRAERPLDIGYQVFVHLLRVNGPLVAQSDKINPGDFPTRQWPLDKYIRDEHQLQLPPDLPPGEYVIAVGLWVQAEGWRLPIFDPNGQQTGDNYILSSLTVN